MNARKKLRLDLDVLRVDSFETALGEEARGTVRGHGSYTDSCSNVWWMCSGCCFTVPIDACSTKCPDGNPETGATTLPCNERNESLDCDTNLCN